jgi:hypothetical protein
MLIDCDGCSMRGIACGDCVVTVLLGHPEVLDGHERTALAVLANGGLVPPLRMCPSGPRATSGSVSGVARDQAALRRSG